MDEKQKDFFKRLEEQGFSSDEIDISIQLLELSDEYITNPKSNDFKNAAQRIISSHADKMYKGD